MSDNEELKQIIGHIQAQNNYIHALGDRFEKQEKKALDSKSFFLGLGVFLISLITGLTAIGNYMIESANEPLRIEILHIKEGLKDLDKKLEKVDSNELDIAKLKAQLAALLNK